MRKGQIAMEYVMVITLALLILLPSIYLFRDYAFESSDQLLDARLNEVSSQIIMKSKRIYYYGPPSRSVLSLDMPGKVSGMFSGYKGKEYLLGFIVTTTKGSQEYVYSSEVPLVPGSSSIVSCNPMPSICSANAIACDCFNESMYSGGEKRLWITASYASCPAGTTSCVTMEMPR